MVPVPPWRATQVAAGNWEALGASPWLVRGIRLGFRVQFEGRPPRGFYPRPHPVRPDLVPWVSGEMNRWVQAGFAREMTAPEGKASPCRSSAFVIEASKLRVVVDLRPLNEHCAPLSGRMESLSSVPVFITRGDHLLSWDWKDAYHHFRLHPADRKYFVFTIIGRWFESVTLPFGWNQSPWLFCKAMRPLVAHLRGRGVGLLPYLDDFLARSPTSPGKAASPEDCAQLAAYLGPLFHRLGLYRHPDKGNFAGAQNLTHLGLVVDTVRGLFLVPPHKVELLQGLASALLREAQTNVRQVSAQALRGFVGKTVACNLAIPLAQFYARATFESIGTHYVGHVTISHQAYRDLRWWTKLASQSLGRALDAHSAGQFLRRRERRRLGSNERRCSSRRPLLHRRVTGTYQRQRAYGSATRSSIVVAQGPARRSIPCANQLNGRPARRPAHGFPVARHHDGTPQASVYPGFSGYTPSNGVYPFGIQPLGRSPIPPSVPRRLALGSADLHPTRKVVRPIYRGPVCGASQRKSGPLQLARPEFRLRGRRLTQAIVGGRSKLLLPALRPYPAGTREGGDRASLDMHDFSYLAGATLVARAPTSRRLSLVPLASTARYLPARYARPVDRADPKSPVAPRSRAAVRWRLDSGQSRLAALSRILHRALTVGTQQRYGSSWARFAEFCAERRLSALPATPAIVVAYLDTLAANRVLAPPSLKIELAAINTMHIMHGLRRPEVGPLLRLAKAGNSTTLRGALPRAPLNIPYMAAGVILSLATWALTQSPCIQLMACAFVISYLPCARGASIAAMQTPDIQLRSSSVDLAIAHRK